MASPVTAPYGSWKSPISAEIVGDAEVGLEQLRIAGSDLYWIERRPQEGGRKVVVRRSSGGKLADVTPVTFNARTRVHEYGGGDYAVHDGKVVFSNFADQRLYVQPRGSEPTPLTPAGAFRYADGQLDPRRNLFFCVREDHSVSREPINTLARVDLDSGETGVLLSGYDFYSSPRLSPDGSRLAWLAWNHPNLPWDSTELWVGRLNGAGSVVEQQKIAGGTGESIVQPEWSPGGTLYFVSDRTGWWNLYRLQSGRIEPLCPMDAEFGQPHWIFGASLYDFASERNIVCSYSRQNCDHLAVLDGQTKTLARLDLPFTSISQLRCSGRYVLFIGATPTAAAAVVKLDLETGEFEILHQSREAAVDFGYLALPASIEFPTADAQNAHGYFYAPKNREYSAPPTEKPPLIVIGHGGPTSSSSSSLKYSVQYWTSRGIAVLDVDYRGSSGYGRTYREQLNGRWGVTDVDDCVSGALFLAQRGDVDGKRLAIRGGSAGGFTTLCALTFRDVFHAGASHYGICDLEALARDTHKFESRYLDRLIGPYPERRDLYVARSPIHFTDRLSCPMIIFQGLEDKIVPPNQAGRMVEALRRKRLPVAYIAFADEQHGFRKAENIKRALEAELYFYSRVFGFQAAGPIEPVEIENL